MSEIASGTAQFNRLPVVERYKRAGWTHLHPILPPLPVDKHRLQQLQSYHGWSDEHARKEWARRFGGKCPGAMDAGGRWYPIGVQGPDVYAEIEDEGSKLGQDCRRAWAQGAGIGVNAGAWPAIDVDLTDPLEARAVRQVLSETYGDVARFRVGQAPKFLMPFRLGESEVAVRKLVLPVHGEAQRIEVLNAGLQWVMEGTHGKTGRAYCWFRRGADGPQDFYRDHHTLFAHELPVLSVADLEALLEALAMVLGREGWVPRMRALGVAERPPAETLLGPEGLIRRVMECWPNDRFLGRDEYVRIGSAIWGASGGEAWGREVFGRWADQHPKADASHDQHVWDSFGRAGGVSIGADWLVEHAPVGLGVRIGWLQELAAWKAETRSDGDGGEGEPGDVL